MTSAPCRVSDYFQAAIPEPHTILGLRLKPFSAGHIVLLNRLDNAFMREGELPGEADLFTALWICSRNFADGNYCLEHAADWRDTMGKWIAAWCRTGGTERPAGLRPARPLAGTQKPRAIDFPDKCRAFLDYLQLGQSTPNYKPIERSVHISFTLELALVQGVKLKLLGAGIVRTEAEFLDRPWGLCLWDYYALKGLSGECEIRDTAAIEAAQQLANNLFAKLNPKVGRDSVKPRTKKKKRKARRGK